MTSTSLGARPAVVGRPPTLAEVAALPRLKTLRIRAGLSQRDLAERAGVQRTTISRLEQPDLQFLPNAKTVRRLAQALGARPADLFGPDWVAPDDAP
jgi:transcriptional regulator with XRE-family HTH domain